MEITLAKREIVVEFADGRLESANKTRVQWFYAQFRVAKARRNKQGKINRLWLLAEPNEIATRITAPATVVKVLATTYTHRESLRKGM